MTPLPQLECRSKTYKMHLITPNHKSGDKSTVKNYQPISLLCVISKVLEHIINDKIIGFITKSISNSQLRFLQRRSTLQQLLIFLTNAYNCLNDKIQTDVVYLDFRKAFDSVPHYQLLFKLRTTEISGNLWSWFKAYPSSRTQCVSVNNQRSHFLPVLSGVPQGSILGPLLFLIYINELPLSTSLSTLLLFAGNTKCFRPIRCYTDTCLLQ